MKILRCDLTGLEADALVDSACGEVKVGAGVDSAVYAKGGKALWARRKAVGAIAEGDAVATAGGGSLKCRAVVHAVVPKWKGGGGGEEAALRNCYRRAAEAARAAGCRSAAFPLLGAGNRGFPAEVALKTAVAELEAEEEREDGLDCTLALYPGAVARLAGRLFGEVRDLLDARFRTDAAIEQSVEMACGELGTSVWEVRGRERFRGNRAVFGESLDESCLSPLPPTAGEGAAVPPELAAELESVGPGVGRR